MSTPSEKTKNATRRFRDETAVKKQLKIAKQVFDPNHKVVKEPHRLVKHHAMDCGNPECVLCGNPRHTHKDGLTVQEKRFYQDTDHIRDKHSNGSINSDAAEE